MRTTLLSLVACLVSLPVLLAPISAGADGPAPSAAVFGQVPGVAGIVVNPSGKLLAWIDNSTPAPVVVIFDLDARALKRRLNLPAEMKLRDLDWADDETLLMHVSLTHSVGPGERSRYEFFRTLAADAAGGVTRVLLLGDRNRSWVTGSTMLATRTPKPKTVIMSAYDFAATSKTQETGSRLRGGRKDSGWVYSLFEVDTRSGEGKLMEQGTPYTDAWVVDGNGQAIARSEWEAERRLFRVLRRNGQGWSEIHRQEDGEMPRISALSRDGSAILAIAAMGQQRQSVWAIPLDGSGAKVLLGDETDDMTSLVYDTYSWAPIGAWVGGVEPEIRWFDPKEGARSKALAKTFAGRRVRITGRSQDGSRVLALVASHGTPATYYLVDYSKGTADIVGEDYPSLADAKLGEVHPISYKARDGMDIPAYLTLPPGTTAEKLPLVVVPHGGPEWHDPRSFDWLAQFLATRGYAVLQPQFRGSTGYGEAHRKAGYRQWGGIMQDDVTDGVKSLIEQGVADARRICIVGMSYGGYAALAGAAFRPDLYACAASINGVSDLPYMIGHVTQQTGDESDSLSYWKDHIGAPQDPNVIAKSPARAAAGIRAPILLLHGADDTVVPIVQSEVMARALKERGKRHIFTRLPGEDHWLSRSESRVRALVELETFLAAPLAAVGN